MAVTELRRGFVARESYALVAREAGDDEQAVRYLPKRLGLHERDRGECPSREARIMALSHSDILFVAIARSHSVEVQTIRRDVIAYGLPADEPGRCALMESRR